MAGRPLPTPGDLSACTGLRLATRAAEPRPYAGPERRRAGNWLVRLLALMLDEIDYGMMLLTRGARVLHANQAARADLAGLHPLLLAEGRLGSRSAQDLPALREALDGALDRGLRRFVTVGEGGERCTLAIVPLPCDAGGPPAALLMLGKRGVCEELSVQGFARCHGLTPAETEVLRGLCGGARPCEIADRQGVRLSTVRTQIGSIRGKTGAASIRALVSQVAVLPPMVSALRGMVRLHGHDAAAAA